MNNPVKKAIIATGIAAKKIDLHPNSVINMPLTIGPPIAPVPIIVI